MSIQERLHAFWAGERPDIIPYTIYEWLWRDLPDDPGWQPLFDLGLGVTWHLPTVKTTYPDVEYRTKVWTEQGVEIEQRTLHTPVGDLKETFVDGWHKKYLLETSADYAIMTHIVRSAVIEPDYERFLEQERALPPFGVALAHVGRTPIQVILVDYAGVENLGYHLFDLEAEVMALYEAMLANFRRTIEIAAAGPGRLIYLLENFSADMIGPARYQKLILPVYDELFPILHSAGKFVSTHYDGKLSSCKDLIARAPMDVLESLTAPPEGDLTLAQARAVWPDKRFWSNLNIGSYLLPADELSQLVRERVRQAAPDGRGLAFGVSEHLPVNWQQSMATVLRTLRDL
ncbi:MAG: hypothetical protein L6Q98_14950 [Anaerolineae bacterium]|nr:hypothetical protein [Anaerolineae bacterium]NUQ04569.1 hypothetical protein [Anaerolineae bacterium]